MQTLPEISLRFGWSRDIGDMAIPSALSSDGRFKLYADARIDNRTELAQQLGLLGKNVATAALILCAFEKWGPGCAHHLIGDFAFVIWDQHSRTAHAACDPMQMRILYYAPLPDGICIASSLPGLMQLAKVSAQIDRVSMASWLAGWPDPNRSMFRNIPLLPSGHWLTANAEDTQLTKFWDIDPGTLIRYASYDQYIDHLFEVLDRCVGDRLSSASSVITAQLSGGMDSTTVCALAAGSLDDSGRHLAVLSHSYQTTAECDETDRIKETVGFLGITESHWLPSETHIEKDFRELYPPALASPGTVCSPRYIDEMALVKQIGSDVLLTGSGGDEMVWGHSLTHTQRLRRGDLGVLVEVARGSRRMDLPVLATLIQLFLKPFVPEQIKRWRRRLRGQPLESRLPAWLPERTIRDLNLDEQLFAPSTVRFENPALQARYDALKRTSTYNSVRSYEQVSRDFGVQVRHPFFDRRLAEFSFAIPDELWIRDSYPKWLLRKTMNGKLPDAVIWNQHKVTFSRFFGSVIANQADNIRAILSDTRLQDMGLVDNTALLLAFDRVVASKGTQLNVDLLYALLTQIWFQQHAPQLSLD